MDNQNQPPPQQPPSMPATTMPKKIILILLGGGVLLGLILLTFILRGTFSTAPPTASLPTPTSLPTSSAPPRSSTLRQVPGLGILGIELVKPQAGEKVISPLAVSGRANVFEGQVSLRIKDADGVVIGQGGGTACMGETPCPFTTQLTFTKPKGKTGTIEAFTLSAKDGSVEDLVSLPILF